MSKYYKEGERIGEYVFRVFEDVINTHGTEVKWPGLGADSSLSKDLYFSKRMYATLARELEVCFDLIIDANDLYDLEFVRNVVDYIRIRFETGDRYPASELVDFDFMKELRAL